MNRNIEGRNEIRFNNSGGKCLLENWVEERATQNLEPTDINQNEINCAQLHRNGHRGLLTLEESKNVVKTTMKDEYSTPFFPQVATEGAKMRMLRKNLEKQAKKEVEQDWFNGLFIHASKDPYTSEKRANFDHEFESMPRLFKKNVEIVLKYSVF